MKLSAQNDQSPNKAPLHRVQAVKCFDKLLWALFLAVAIIGAITGLAVFEHNYHPRIYRHSEEVTILQGGEWVNFNHPRGFAI